MNKHYLDIEIKINKQIIRIKEKKRGWKGYSSATGGIFTFGVGCADHHVRPKFAIDLRRAMSLRNTRQTRHTRHTTHAKTVRAPPHTHTHTQKEGTRTWL
jgi:hypothetical protein